MLLLYIICSHVPIKLKKKHVKYQLYKDTDSQFDNILKVFSYIIFL